MSLASDSQELTQFLFVGCVSGFTMVMFICCSEMQRGCECHTEHNKKNAFILAFGAFFSAPHNEIKKNIYWEILVD